MVRCNDPGGSGSLAHVSIRNVADVIHAAEACPGECIFIEIDVPLGTVEDRRPDDGGRLRHRNRLGHFGSEPVR